MEGAILSCRKNTERYKRNRRRRPQLCRHSAHKTSKYISHFRYTNVPQILTIAQLTSELTKLQERLKSTTEEKAYLKTRLETLQRRHRHSQDEVLTLRGRLTLSHKAQEQLQLKCSAMEKATPSSSSSSSPPPPAAVRAVGRSKEESKLASECRRKVN